MEQDPRRWISALRRSHDDLAEFISRLTPDDLVRPSTCTEWNVAQLLSHLGSGAEIGLGNFEAAVADRELPAPESFAPIWERWNNFRPEEMAASFVEADERLVGVFERLDDDALARLRVPLPFLPEPIDAAALGGFRLSEHALHSWDVYSSFDPAAKVAPYATELLIDRLPMMVALLDSFGALVSPPSGPVVLFVATSEPSRRFLLDLGDAIRLEPEPGGDGGGDGEVALGAEALLRLSAGRLRPQHTPEDVALSGPLSLEDLRLVFPGF